MPLYAFVCPCGESREEMRPASERDLPQMCACGQTMARRLQAPHVAWAPGVHPKHETSRALAAAQFEDPGTIKKLDSGELRTGRRWI